MKAVSDFVAQSNARARESGASFRLFYGTAAEVKAQKAASHVLDKKAASAASAALPKGISAGKMTAIVAGVALAGGTLYALTHRKEKNSEPVGPWTARVEEERAAQANGLQR